MLFSFGSPLLCAPGLSRNVWLTPYMALPGPYQSNPSLLRICACRCMQVVLRISIHGLIRSKSSLLRCPFVALPSTRAGSLLRIPLYGLIYLSFVVPVLGSGPLACCFQVVSCPPLVSFGSCARGFCCVRMSSVRALPSLGVSVRPRSLLSGSALAPHASRILPGCCPFLRWAVPLPRGVASYHFIRLHILLVNF